MTGFVLIEMHIKEYLTIFGVIILTEIVNIEFIQTNIKSELIVFEGYGHIRNQQITHGASSWRCCITKCNGRVRLFFLFGTIFQLRILLSATVLSKTVLSVHPNYCICLSKF